MTHIIVKSREIEYYDGLYLQPEQRNKKLVQNFGEKTLENRVLERSKR
jgi:hypothetical protein